MNNQNLPLLDYAKIRYGDEKVEDIKQVISVFRVFVAIPVFWALFDQHSSRWVFQAEKLNLDFFGYPMKASQIQILNPFCLLLLLLVFNKVIYPLFDKYNIVLTPLYHKMGTGMFFASLSFISSALLEIYITDKPLQSVPWFYIIPQFFLLSIGEILVSVTGLEFAYSQAPKEMKSLVMAGWLVTVAIGNALVAVVALIKLPNYVLNFCLYAALMALFMILFLFVNKGYVEKKYNNKF